MNDLPLAHITFSGLFQLAAEGEDAEVPLTALSGPDEHIHGHLVIAVGDRVVPQMGFWGPHDVCFNTWFEELETVVRELRDRPSATYVFDEGEQGQPAFQFARDDDLLRISVIDSLISDGVGDESFQSVACSWNDFLAQIYGLFENFRVEVLAANPTIGPLWLEKHLPRLVVENR